MKNTARSFITDLFSKLFIRRKLINFKKDNSFQSATSYTYLAISGGILMLKVNFLIYMQKTGNNVRYFPLVI
ncbi:hypothetical protein HDF23_000530 [Mucilaginibacter lappiensis]|uniref:Transposase n=1 Tax=Mucilaginibacter lappiensis TaxID=354630 RepID=A0ABR6PDG1_9SPHI|nr:hypothetical protein [Mucilaginibacter lappiensis]